MSVLICVFHVLCALCLVWLDRYLDYFTNIMAKNWEILFLCKKEQEKYFQGNSPSYAGAPGDLYLWRGLLTPSLP